MTRPSAGSIARKQLKNELRAVIIDTPEELSFMIYQGVSYDLPAFGDLKERVRYVMQQVKSPRRKRNV